MGLQGSSGRNPILLFLTVILVVNFLDKIFCVVLC
jgi:hypothetical protein